MNFARGEKTTMDGRAAAGSYDNHPNDGQHSDPNRRVAHWFQRWRKPVRQFLSRRAFVPAAELDDLAQDVFLRLLRYSPDTQVDNPLGYLLRIASNVASEWRERARVARPHESDWLDDLLIEDEDEPENHVSRQRARAAVQAAVDALPDFPRQAFLLHNNEGLKHKEIAKRLGRSRRMVVRDLTTAYSQLRVRLRYEDR